MCTVALNPPDLAHPNSQHLCFILDVNLDSRERRHDEFVGPGFLLASAHYL
jgi:hypothetical protein